MGRSTFEDPDFEDITSGKVDPQDILSEQRARNAQSAMDAGPVPSATRTAVAKDAPTAPASALDEVGANGPQAGDTRADFAQRLGEGIRRGILPTERPRDEQTAAEQARTSAQGTRQLQSELDNEARANDRQRRETAAEDAATANAQARADHAAAAAKARADHAAAAKARHGAIQNFKADGGLTHFDEAGNEVPKMQPNPQAGAVGPTESGAPLDNPSEVPLYKAGNIGEEPYQNDEGRWKRTFRDTFGNTQEIDLEANKEIHTNLLTGEKSIRWKGQNFAAGMDDNVVERNKLKSTQLDLERDTQQERLDLADARLRHGDAKEAVKPFAKQVTAAQTSLDNLTRQMGTATGKGRASLAAQIAEKQKILADPNYLAAKAKLDEADAEVGGHEKTILDKRGQALEITRNIDKLKAARMLPAGVSHGQAAVGDALGAFPPEAITTDASGRKSLDADFIEARIEAHRTSPIGPTESGKPLGQDGQAQVLSHTAAAKGYYEGLQAQGIGAIGGKPIEEAIAKSAAAETKLKALGVIGEQVRAGDPTKAVERFDTMPAEDRFSFMQALPMAERQKFQKAVATHRAMAVVLAGDDESGDLNYELLDPQQKNLVREAIGKEGMKALAMRAQFRAQQKADTAAGEAEQSAYQNLGIGGKSWQQLTTLTASVLSTGGDLLSAGARLVGAAAGGETRRLFFDYATGVDDFYDDLRGPLKGGAADMLGNIIGSSMAFIAGEGVVISGMKIAGAGAKALSIGAKVTTGVMGAAMGAGDSLGESDRLGLGEKATWARAFLATGLGATQIFGIPRQFEELLNGAIKVNRASGGGLKGLLVAAAKGAGKPAGIIEETGQEIFQQSVGDLADKLGGIQKVTDEKTGLRREQKWSEMLADSGNAGVQAALGAVLYGGFFAVSAHVEDRAALRKFATTLDTDGGYAVMHDMLRKLRGQLVTARQEGDGEAVSALKDRIDQAQFALGEAAKKVTALAPDARAKIGRLISPTLDAEGLGKQLDGNETLRFASAEIGAAMRPFYLQGDREQAVAEAAGGKQAAVDQMIGAHAVATDLVGVLENGKIEGNKAAALDHLGLLHLQTNDDGSTTYQVTDDALALFPPALRDAVANDAAGKYNFKVTAGNPGAIANNLVKSGEDRLRAAAEAANAGGKGQTSNVERRTSNVEGGGTEAGAKGSAKGSFKVSLKVEMPGVGPKTVAMTVSAQNEAEAVKIAVAQARAQKGAKISVVGVAAVTSPTVEVKTSGPTSHVDEAEAGAVFGRTLKKWRKDLAKFGVTKIAEAKEGKVKLKLTGVSTDLLAKYQAKLAAREGGVLAIEDHGGGNVDVTFVNHGPMAIIGDTLVYQRSQIAALINERKDASQSADEATEDVVVHELIHSVAETVISKEEAEQIFANAPDKLLALAGKTYANWEQLTPYQKGHELLRLVVEGRYRGKITEQIYQALQKVLEAIGIQISKLPENTLLTSAADKVKAALDAERVDIGKSRVGGEAVVEAGASGGNAPASVASAFEISTPQGGVKVRGQWKVVEASELTTSDRPDYNPELQRRQRDRSASKAQVAEIAHSLDPARLGESATSDTGSPIINPKGEVLSGNGRTMALRQVYERAGTKAAEYRAFVEEKAAALGLSVEGVRNPVLVREVTDFGKSNETEFADLSNRSALLGRSAVETAMDDGRMLKEEGLLEHFAPGEDGSVLTAGNRNFNRLFIQHTADRAQLLRGDGSFSPELEGRVRRAVLATIMQGLPDATEAVTTALERADKLGLSRQINGIMSAAGRILKLQTSNPEMDIAGPLAEALSGAIEARGLIESGKAKNAEEALSQGVLFAEPSAAGKILTRELLGRNGRGVRELLTEYARVAESVASGPTMFGETAPGLTPAQVLENIVNQGARDKARAEAARGLKEALHSAHVSDSLHPRYEEIEKSKPWLKPLTAAMRALPLRVQTAILEANDRGNVPLVPTAIAPVILRTNAAYESKLQRGMAELKPRWEAYRAEFTPEIRAWYDREVSAVAEEVGAFAMVGVALKGDRGMEKALAAASENGTAPDVTTVNDVVRGSLVVLSDADVNRAVAAIKARFEVVKHKDRFANPLLGYRDHLLLIRLPNGRNAEVQVHRVDLLFAKEVGVGHGIYEHLRSNKEAMKLAQTPELATWQETLESASLEFYGGVSAAFLNSSSETFSASPSSDLETPAAVIGSSTDPSGRIIDAPRSATNLPESSFQNSVPGGNLPGSLAGASVIKRVIQGNEGSVNGGPLFAAQISPKHLASLFENAAEEKGPIDISGGLDVEAHPGLFGKGLGVPRAEMPQIPQDHKADFLAWLKERGVGSREMTANALVLKPSQGELDAVRIGKMVAHGAEQMGAKPILISIDGHVIDGHHRWAAQVALGFQSGKMGMPVTQIDLPIREALSRASDFMKVAGIAPREMDATQMVLGSPKVKDTGTLDMFAPAPVAAAATSYVKAAVASNAVAKKEFVKKAKADGLGDVADDLFGFAVKNPPKTDWGKVRGPSTGAQDDRKAGALTGSGEGGKVGKDGIPGDHTNAGSTPEGDQAADGGAEGQVPGPNGQGDSGNGGGRDSVSTPGTGDGRGSDAGRGLVERRLPDDPAARNHVIGDGDEVAPRTPAAKYAANLEAVRLLKRIEAGHRLATPEEKATLAKYTGWGWAGEYFNPDNAKFARQHAELTELLTPEEFAAARASTTNAHYTALPVIDAAWKIAQRLGFEGGRALEPAGGVGHFLGRVPAALARRTSFAGVELDSLSARMMAQLYPEAEIQHSGFERAKLPDHSFDLAISNVPFGNYTVPGARDYPKLLIHDYFFARGLDKVRPGGLVVFITSDGTLDKSDKAVRAMLAEKADLVGAIRLPNNAFAANAGTEVTTDLIILRKKDGTPFRGADWMNRREVGRATITEEGKEVERAITVNQYFAEHPGMALGEHTLQGTMYRGGDYALVAGRGQDTPALMDAAIARLPANVMGATTSQVSIDTKLVGQLAGAGTKEGAYVQKDDGFFQVLDGRLTPAAWLQQRNFGDRFEQAIDEKTQRERTVIAEDWLNLREAVVELINAETREGIGTGELATLRLRLNGQYDRYVRRWGTLNKRFLHLEKAAFLEDDPEYPLLQSIETEVVSYDAEGKKKLSWKTADIFRKRTREPRSMPETAANVEDAVNVALGFEGKVTPATVARLLGVSAEEAKRQIISSGRAFENPGTGLLEMRERYLSGNVRDKLAKAEAAAADNADYVQNVEALRAALPKDIPLSGIYLGLASRWLPAEVTTAFATELLGSQARVSYIRAANRYSVSLADSETPENSTTHGTKDFKGRDLLIHALNGTEPQVMKVKVDANGNAVTRGESREPVMERDMEATQVARSKMASIQKRFGSWVKTTTATVADGRAVQEVVEQTYNQTQNAMVAPSYSGDYLVDLSSGEPVSRIPGLSNAVWMNAHRRSVVARILQEGSAVMAHGVGSGKTFSQIVAAMEMRRLGLARKPMIVVQKATIGQFAKSVREAYPTARALVATEKTFEKKNRRRFLGRIATGDYDMVILTQPQFDRLLPGESLVRTYFDERLAALEEAIRDTRESEGKRDPKTKELEAAKRRLEAKMERMLAGLTDRGDDTLAFEQLGVDALLVDEAHAYKKTSLMTNLRRVKGVPNDESQRAMGLEMKAGFIQERNSGRNVVLATGTPITNSMAESYIMLKLATPHVLAEYGIGNFDEFAHTFGQTQTKLEYSWGGKWKLVTRFNKFVNGSELITMIRSGFDVKMGNKALGLKVPRMIHESGADKPEIVIVPQTPAMVSVTDWITSIADEYERVMKQGSADEKQAAMAVPIVTMQAGMAAAMDPRLLFPSSPDAPGSKVNTAIRRIVEMWHESAAEKGAQVIFADRFKPMNIRLLESFAGGADFAVDTESEESEDGAALADGEEEAEGNAGLAAVEEAEFRGGGFNLYYDIREKLERAGIPRAEIAIIHEYGTDQKRGDLFDAINEGQIRVVIGSTEKLGVGVNMQRKLFAAHHLDPPRSMTPAMMEQRDGRIIRQGNSFEAVYNVRYGVERSMDTGIYQMLENKGRFIAQALSGQGVGRTFDDAADELTMSMAEMKAMLTGDTRVLRMAELQGELQELESELGGFENEKSALARKRASLTGEAQRTETRDIPHAEALEPWLAGKFKGDSWKATVNGKEIVGERKDIADALDSALRKAAVTAVQTKNNQWHTEATIDGLKVTLVTNLTADAKEVSSIGMVTKSPIDENRVLRESRISGGAGALQSLQSLRSAYEGQADELRAQVAKTRAQLATIGEEMAKPWDRQAEYDAKTAELAKIQGELLRQATAGDAPEVLGSPRVDPNQATFGFEDSARAETGEVRDVASPPPSTRLSPRVGSTALRSAQDDLKPALSVAELVKENMGLAVSMAASYRNIRGHDFENVLGEARKALVKAAQGYEQRPGGAPFGAYAGTAIRNTLNSLFNKNMKIAAHEVTSADAPSGEHGDGQPLKDLLDDPGAAAAVSGGVEHAETASELGNAMSDLPTRVRMVLDMHAHGAGLREIGAAIGLSHEMARRILDNGKKAVAARLKARGFKGVDADGVLYASRVAVQRAAGEVALSGGSEIDFAGLTKQDHTSMEPRVLTRGTPSPNNAGEGIEFSGQVTAENRARQHLIVAQVFEKAVQRVRDGMEPINQRMSELRTEIGAGSKSIREEANRAAVELASLPFKAGETQRKAMESHARENAKREAYRQAVQKAISNNLEGIALTLPAGIAIHEVTRSPSGFLYPEPKFTAVGMDGARVSGTADTAAAAVTLFHKKQAYASPESLDEYAAKFGVEKDHDIGAAGQSFERELSAIRARHAELTALVNEAESKAAEIEPIEAMLGATQEAKNRLTTLLRAAAQSTPTTLHLASEAKTAIDQLLEAGMTAPQEHQAAAAALELIRHQLQAAEDERQATTEASRHLSDEEAAPTRARDARLTAKARVMARAQAARAVDYSALMEELLDEKHGSPLGAVERLWRSVSKSDEAFLYPTTTSRSMEEIARVMSGGKMEVTMQSDGDYRLKLGDGVVELTNPDTHHPKIHAPNADSRGKARGGGTLFYQVITAWAHNNGKTIHPSNALTAINAYVRRTSNMLSSALRFGTTRHMIPDDAQGVKGWKRGEDRKNIARLAMREMEQTMAAFPQLQRLTIDPQTGVVMDDAGTHVDGAGIEAVIRESDGKGFGNTAGIGETTAKRAIITRYALEAFKDGRAVGQPAGSFSGLGEKVAEANQGVLYSSAIAENEIGEEADLSDPATSEGRVTPEQEKESRPQEFLKEMVTRFAAGRLDALDFVVPGAKNLLTDSHIGNSRIASALRIFRERMEENVKKSFGYPSLWRNPANAKRLARFTAELLPTAARLHAVAQGADGRFKFESFFMRAGEIGVKLSGNGRPLEAAKRMGVNGGMVAIREGVFIQGRHGEKLRVGKMMDTFTAGRRRVFWQLERLVPASEQESIHENFHAKYPESAHWLDSWINPNLRESRVSIGGVDLPDFNRFSLHDFWGEISPFGPVGEVKGYTPDIFMTKSLVGMIAGRVKDLLNRTWTGPGREYKSGEARERGSVRNLFEGFNARAAEAHQETQRRELAEKLLAKALKPIPEGGVPNDFVRWDTETIDQLLRSYHAAQGLDPAQYQALKEKVRELGRDEAQKSPELGLHFSDSDLSRIEKLAGQVAKEAAENKDMMIHRTALAELRRPLANQYINNRLLRIIDAGLKGATGGYLANPFTLATNQLSNEVFITMHTLRRALYGVMSLPFDTKQGKLGLYEAGNLLKGVVTDRFYNKAVRELVPDELFDGNHRFNTIAAADFEKSPVELLRELNISGAILKGMRYGNVDMRGKQRVAFASYMAHGRIAYDEARAAGKVSANVSKGAWIKDWVQHLAPDSVHRSAYHAAMLVAMDYSNVPAALDETSQVTIGGRDVTAEVNMLRRGIAPFAKFPYNLARQGKRFTFDSVRDLLPGNAKVSGVELSRGGVTTSAQKRQAAANLTMMTMMYLLARMLMDDDKDGTPKLGREVDDLGKRLEGAYQTSGRINITDTPLGKTITAALDMMGLHDLEEQEQWLRIRAFPYASSAVALASLEQMVRGNPGGQEAEANAMAVLSDMVSEGILLKMVNAMRDEKGPYDQGKNTSFIAGETVFDMATGRFLPPPLLRTANALIDPVARRSRPVKSLDYDPGFGTAVRMKIPGAGQGLPPAGRIVNGAEGSDKTETAVAELLSRELPEGSFRHYIDAKGKAKVAYVMPGKVQVRPRVLELFRAAGLNVKFVDQGEYERELAGM